MSAARAAVLLSALGFATFENFVQCEEQTLRRYLQRLANTAGEEAVIVAAQKQFIAEMRGDGCRAADMAAEDAEIEEVFRAAGLDPTTFL